MSPERERLRSAGEQAVQALRATLAEGLAELLRRDPDRLAAAVDTGLVSRDWLEHPGERPILEAAPTEVLRRFAERAVEQHPSVLGSLGLSAIQLLSSGDAPVGEGRAERRAVVFTDLAGFTAYTAAEGDDAACALLAEHHRAVEAVVRSRGGRVVKRVGDGTLCTFDAPEAGVLAALELVDRCREPLAVRAGIHVGDVVVLPDDVVGHVVNLTARVAESARGGEVLATDAVFDAVETLPGVRWGRFRARRYKGIDAATRVCRVRGPATSERAAPGE